MTPIVIIECPMPPSVNRIWRSKRGANGKPSFFPSKEYKKWMNAFDSVVMAMVPRPKVMGPFNADIFISEKKRRSNADVDNRGKVVLDSLQRCGIIENDSLAQSVTLQWGYAPEGCRVVLTEAV